VFPSLLHTNKLRRYNSVVLSKLDEIQASPVHQLKIDEMLDIFGLLDEFVKNKHIPFILNLMNLLIAAKQQFTQKHKNISFDIKNSKLKARLFEYSHVIDSTK